MSLFSASQIAGFQRLANDSLPETATISRNTPAADGYGGYTDSWATSSTVAARIAERRLRPDEQLIASQIEATVVYTIRLPADTDVRERDRIVINGRTFEIAGVVRKTWPVMLKVVCTEVTN